MALYPYNQLLPLLPCCSDFTPPLLSYPSDLKLLSSSRNPPFGCSLLLFFENWIFSSPHCLGMPMSFFPLCIRPDTLFLPLICYEYYTRNVCRNHPNFSAAGFLVSSSAPPFYARSYSSLFRHVPFDLPI